MLALKLVVSDELLLVLDVELNMLFMSSSMLTESLVVPLAELVEVVEPVELVELVELVESVASEGGGGGGITPPFSAIMLCCSAWSPAFSSLVLNTPSPSVSSSAI